MKDGQQIRFSEEGDQEPGIETGDLVIVLDEREHDVYTRSTSANGMNLEIKMTISLAEALCGFTTSMETLDHRHLVITSYPG